MLPHRILSSVKNNIIILLPHHMVFSYFLLPQSFSTSHLSRWICQKVLKDILGWWHSQIQCFAPWVAISKHLIKILLSLLMAELLKYIWKASLSIECCVISSGCHQYKEVQKERFYWKHNIFSLPAFLL